MSDPTHIIKVCGLTSAADAEHAIAAGSNALGFNFWPGSPRYLDPATAHWIATLPRPALRIGVFVDESPSRVAEIAQHLELDIAQIHRGDSPANLPIWRAVSIDEAEATPATTPILVDAPPLNNGQPGGTGRTYDWTRVRGLSPRLIVAGGLDPSNVRLAIRQAQPWGVDACSRLESAPGIKDHNKVRDFIHAAREEFSCL